MHQGNTPEARDSGAPGSAGSPPKQEAPVEQAPELRVARAPAEPLEAGFDEGGAVQPGRLGPSGVMPSRMSPQLVAVFGAVFGAITISSIIALLIQAVPKDRDRSELALVDAKQPPAEAASPPPVRVPEEPAEKRTAIPGPWRISELSKDATVSIVSGTIERQSFINAVTEKGVPKSQVYRILKAFQGLRKFDKCGRKDQFVAALDRGTRRLLAFEYVISPTEIFQAREVNNVLTGEKLDMKIAENEVTRAFYVTSNVTASYKAAGLEDGILNALDDAFNGKVSPESFEEASVVRLIAIEETALGLFAHYKNIVAAEYRPPDPSAKPIRVYYFRGEQARGYFDEQGKQPFEGGWRAPVPGAPVTSKFNPKRLHPVLKTVMPHTGTDFGAEMGTPVYSAYRGVVDWVGPHGVSGNLVTVTHPNGVQTGYAHLSRFAPGLASGTRVGTHQLVGYVGSTGRSTGPHLHFSAKKDGKFFDAETLQLDGVRVMPVVDRPRFAAYRAELDARLEAIPLPDPPPEPTKPVAQDVSAVEAQAASSAVVATPPPEGFAETGDEEMGEPIQGPALGAAPPSQSAAGKPQ